MHPHDTPPRSVRAHVITVSTSRSAAEDRSGPVIRDRLTAAGHRVVGTDLVPDDPNAIGAALDRALGEAELVLLTGGTGFSGRDCTAAVVSARFDREIPGFGEIFRMLSWEQVGAKAMFSSAVAGIARGRLVFALPGSPRACELALDKLILPEIAHMVHELEREPVATVAPITVAPPTRASTTPSPETLPAAQPLAPPREGIVITEKDAMPVSTQDNPVVAPANTWLAALEKLGGKLERGRAVEIPEALTRMAAVVDVLNTAGERAVVRMERGGTYLAFGFPDLRRAASKVLLVREAEPIAEIVALHRWPKVVGVCAEGEGIVPGADLDPAFVAEERVGHRAELPGALLAVEGEALWVVHGRTARRYDGRLSEPQPLSTAIGSLVLDWSQR